MTHVVGFGIALSFVAGLLVILWATEKLVNYSPRKRDERDEKKSPRPADDFVSLRIGPVGPHNRLYELVGERERMEELRGYLMGPRRVDVDPPRRELLQ